MKTFLVLSLLAMAATMATAQYDPSEYDPSEQYDPYFEQQPFIHPLLQQQMMPCQVFLMQQCSPVAMVPFLRSQILQQSSCLVMRQQCCQQLAQIPQQLRCPAIHSIVHAIIMQQQVIQAQQMGLVQPQAQMAGQLLIQPQQLPQYQAMKVLALQTLPAMCNVQVPPYCSIAPLAGIAAGIGGC